MTGADPSQADVLVIDDSDLARASMRRALTDAHLRVIDLPSPIGATSAILRSQVRVVVVDVNMPSIRGDKLAALFRKSARMSTIGIILISGTEVEALDRLAREVGADAVLPKSAGTDALVMKVKALLARPL